MWSWTNGFLQHAPLISTGPPTTPSAPSIRPQPPSSQPHLAIPLHPPSFNTGNPILMDIDCNKRRGLLPIICVRCRQVGHKSSPNCLLRFDVHVATIDELQIYLEDKLTALDVVSRALEYVATEAEDEKDADKGFPSHTEWIACPHCQTTTISLFSLLMKWMKQLKPLKSCINLSQTHLRLTVSNGRDGSHLNLSLLPPKTTQSLSDWKWKWKLRTLQRLNQ